MANARLVREALLRLFEAKEGNSIRQEAAKNANEFNDAGQAAIANSQYAEDALTRARQQAREVQGIDPLQKLPLTPSGTLSPENRAARRKYVTGAESGINQDPSRLPDRDPNTIINDLARRTGSEVERGGFGPSQIKEFENTNRAIGAAEVPGSNEAITLFEQVSDLIESGAPPEAVAFHLERLRQISPEFFAVVQDQIKGKRGINPTIADDISAYEDEIPF